MTSVERCVALAIYLNGRMKMDRDEIERIAGLFGITTRSIYRYLNTIGRAMFLLKDYDLHRN